MGEIDNIGADWIVDEMASMTDEVEHITPSAYNEANRYLPESVTSIPGYMRFSVNPFMKEIVDCFDIDSPVREVSLKKGVQITYTTVLESGLLYYIGHIKSLPMMYITADKELAKARVENNIIPMLNQSDMADLIQSSDIGNSRKTGKTANHLQFAGGGYLIPFGANNADKMRSFSIMLMMKDEIDAWPDVVGKDGDPDALTSDRCSGYWERRKIFRGSTPLLEGSSKIQSAFLNGDQRVYTVLCKHCGFPQVLRWERTNKDTGEITGFKWDMEEGALILESVRYCCMECGGEHYEHDKERLFSLDYGAHWLPTAKPTQPNIRSYHLPALYSPIGMAPWYKCVADYLSGFDMESRKVKDIGKYQAFYNNILAEPFQVFGSRITMTQVSFHRRPEYKYGQIPNVYASKWSGSPILFLTCQVDVHKSFLAVAVMGWCKGAKCYLIDYWRFETEKDEDDCSEISSPVWGRLREVIEEKVYTADDGKKYSIVITLVDAGYANDTVNTFCSDYGSGVYPSLGASTPGKIQKIAEFTEFTTQAGTIGYKILVDHYKDRLAPVLRREWVSDSGEQKPYHFNAPVDITTKQLQELTAEIRKKKTNERNEVTYFWHRSGNARNELWDLLVYGHCAVEIIAWMICIEHFELKKVDWAHFWQYIEEEKLYFSE